MRVTDFLSAAALSVDGPSDPRWQRALEMLRAGGYVLVRGVGLTLRTDLPSAPATVGKMLRVRVTSGWAPENLTRTNATVEIENARRLVEELSRASPAFAELVAGPVQYELLYDYGMGAIRLCSLLGGEWSWGWPLKDKDNRPA